MKELIDKTIAPEEMLLNTIMNLPKGYTEDEVRVILSGYRVMYADDKSVVGILPDWVKKGSKVHITRTDEGIRGWDLRGEVIDVLLKNNRYDYNRIANIIEKMGYNKDDASYSLHIYEESKPAIYNRIVMEDREKGVLIVPCVAGVTIKEDAK